MSSRTRFFSWLVGYAALIVFNTFITSQVFTNTALFVVVIFSMYVYYCYAWLIPAWYDWRTEVKAGNNN